MTPHDNRRNCVHFRQPGLCEVDGCPHSGALRDPVKRAFGGDGLPIDSAFASRLFKENRELYNKYREAARASGRLPVDVVPEALRDE